MTTITKEFFERTNIQETSNHTVEQIMDFLSSPESIMAMVLMTKLGQPALAGVVKELEERFAFSDFPLHPNGPGANATNRRNIGWMVKFVMGSVGFEPKKVQSDTEMRLRKFCKTKYFTTSALYQPVSGLPRHSVIAKVL